MFLQMSKKVFDGQLRHAFVLLHSLHDQNSAKVDLFLHAVIKTDYVLMHWQLRLQLIGYLKRCIEA